MVVGDHLVVEHPDVAALLLQAGHVEHQDAAGVAGGDVVVDVGVDGVLDLDAGHVLLCAAAPHDDAIGLAHVDAGVRRADGNRVLDQHVLRQHRIQAVGAVLGARTAGPFDLHAPDGDVFRLADLQAVALGILDGQVLDGEVVAVDQQALGAGFLALEAEHGLVHAGAADGHAVRAQGQAAIEMIGAGGYLDDIARLGVEQALMELLREIRAGRVGLGRLFVGLRLAGRQRQCQTRHQHRPLHRVPSPVIARRPTATIRVRIQ